MISLTIMIISASVTGQTTTNPVMISSTPNNTNTNNANNIIVIMLVTSFPIIGSEKIYKKKGALRPSLTSFLFLINLLSKLNVLSLQVIYTTLG